MVAELRYRSAVRSEAVVHRLSLPISQAMLATVGPMFRGIAAAQQDVATATITAMQAIGEVAVAGEVVQVARRSCSRRRLAGETFSPGVGPTTHA